MDPLPDASTEFAARSWQVDLESGNPTANSLVDSLADRIWRKIPQIDERKRGPTIWRVPAHLKKAEKEAYEPKLVSIGPLHHNKEELLPMEEVKRAYLGRLLKRDAKNCLKRYVEKILNCLPRVKLDYSEKIEFSDEDLVEMLVVDGCFIIEYFARRLFNTNYKMPFLPQVRWGFSHLNRDLLLLENQIPFFVLTSLFEVTKIPTVPSSLKKLADIINMPGKQQLDFMMLAIKFLDLVLPQNKYPKEEDVWHLLHLKHLCMDPMKIQDFHVGCSLGKQIALWPVKTLSNLVYVIFFGVFYLIFFRDWPPIFGSTKKSENQCMTPCATELLEAGIRFERKTFREFDNACQLKVSFTDGTLKIPFLLLNDDTSSHLRNLIALEQSCGPLKNTHFTSYCVFMDNIINTSDDVAVLTSRGILESMLGSDSEVAQLFNSLCEEVSFDTDEHYNCRQFEDVREYCEFTHHRWRAQLVRTGFKNPWVLFSLMGGVLLLMLTATQTFTVFPRD